MGGRSSQTTHKLDHKLHTTNSLSHHRRRGALTCRGLPKGLKAVVHCGKRAEFCSTMLPRRASRRDRADASRPKMSRVGRVGAEIEPVERR